jgi:hypothetical protein
MVVATTPKPLSGTTPVISVAEVPTASPPNPMALCHSLVGDR